ncbi:hypothetical protein USDA257_c45610 [Sinorhizobium fredii USDA 257]|uniref:Uncharacterized protein n=1 Tax=Sinorhizobium fredii (strain USDA 257) TaxID=1185652 RepID=I3XB43_SINF2|nr:hypothetical protein USDA257_c45610 [Sinorhizobium fredii USDA 257]
MRLIPLPRPSPRKRGEEDSRPVPRSSFSRGSELWRRRTRGWRGMRDPLLPLVGRFGEGP